MINTIKELLDWWPVTGFVTRELFELDLDGDYFRIVVYGDRITVPVFHIIDINTYTDIAVCIYESRFYQYNHNKDYTCAPFLVDLFDRTLREQNKDHPEFTNWEYIAHNWKSEHADQNYNKEKYQNLQQPDYTKLENNPIVKRSFARMLISKWNA